MLVDVTDGSEMFSRAGKPSEPFVLVRLKTEAILYASPGLDVHIIAEMTGQNESTVRNWFSAYRAAWLSSVVAGHDGNENAAKLTRAQKEQLKESLVNRLFTVEGIRGLSDELGVGTGGFSRWLSRTVS